MKVLLINGSPHREGNTFIALSEVAKALEANGVGSQCDVRPPEQLFHHQQHAGGVVAILEQCTRKVAWRSHSGYRRIIFCSL